MKNFDERLTSLLKKDSRFVDQEGDLLKSEVIDKAYKVDRKLIELLLENPKVKAKFFIEIKKHWVFNINDFVAYIQDKHFLNESYTKYKNKIGLTIDEKFLRERGEVALVWPFKDCVLEGGMTKEDEKRKEIFFNQILAQDEIDRLFTPKVLTNWKRYAQDGAKKVKKIQRDKDGTIRENLIIKGNNLLALHSLKHQFQGRIKLIYIDPPYNTGSDSFGYNDNFNHSTWLTFMKNRLEVARKLLREDGVIWVHCDDNEQAYLKVLMDEIFERENFIECAVWKNKYGAGAKTKGFITIHEHILFYGRNPITNIEGSLSEKEIKKYNKKDSKFPIRGPYRTQPLQTRSLGDRPNLVYPITYKEHKIWPNKQWVWSKKRMMEAIKNDEVEFTENNGKISVRGKQYLKDKDGNIRKGKPLSIIEGYYTQEGTKELRKIFKDNKNIFSFPKPPSLIKYLIGLNINGEDNKDAIILDFFAGSGTTAQAVLDLNKEDGGNRKFILVEQMGYAEEITVERVKRIIKNNAKDKNLFDYNDDVSFICCGLMKYNQTFIEKIQKAKNTKELLKIWKEIKKKGFLHYNVDIKKFDKTINEFKKLSLDKQKRVLVQLLNKNQLYVNLSEIDDVGFEVNEEDKRLNMEFYEK